MSSSFSATLQDRLALEGGSSIPHDSVLLSILSGCFVKESHIPTLTMLRFADVRDEGDTFTVKPVEKHHQPTSNGVRFNVQSVSSDGSPLRIRDRSDTSSFVKNTVEDYYRNVRSSAPRFSPEHLDVHIEATSVSEDTLAKHYATSLMEVALTAFAKHFPLSLRPDDIWVALAYGAAKHIDANAEELRGNFVSHKGKILLNIDKHDAVLGHVPKDEWERDIFAGFSAQILKHIGDKTHQLFTTPFSTTTKADQAASEITLMAATTKYFDFQMTTMCGIPWIELQGEEQDWIALRERARNLENVLLPDFAATWLPHLLPVLDEFVEAYKGNVNHEFWQRMCKRVSSRMSGVSDSISGWISNLYPYLKGGKVNHHIKPWRSMSTFGGPDPEDFPQILSSVPVVWKYHLERFPLHFHAGYLGMSQDADTLALHPHVGWIVSHDPPKEPDMSQGN